MDLHLWQVYHLTKPTSIRNKIRNKLVMDNMGLVYSFVRESFPGRDEADLVQAGAIGLMEALDQYNPAKGGFATFARFKILHQVQKTIRQNKGQTSSKSGKETTARDQAEILGWRLDVKHGRTQGVMALSTGGIEAVESRLDLDKLTDEVSDLELSAMVARMDDAPDTELAEVFALDSSRQSRLMAADLADIALSKAREVLSDG